MRRLVPRITTARAEDPADSFLMPLRISSAEIRLLMRQVLGHALSGRTLNCPARSTGSRLKRGHPPTTPRVHKGDMSDLIDLTNRGIGVFSGYRLQSVHHVQVPFGPHTPSVSQVGGKVAHRRSYLGCNESFHYVQRGDRDYDGCRASPTESCFEEYWTYPRFPTSR